MKDKKLIELNSIVTQAKSLVSSDMDGETVMMSIENGKYYGMDPIGSRIWKLIEKPQSPSVLCEILLNEYNIDQEICQQHVLEFLNKLSDQGLVV